MGSLADRHRSQLLDQALKAYSSTAWYRDDVARINFLHARLLNASSKPGEAQIMLQKSVEDFNRRFLDMHWTTDNLIEADFDKFARYGFWSP